VTALATSISIAAKSNSAFTNRATFVTSLILTPVLDVLLLVAVLSSVGVMAGASVRDATYASIVLAFGLAVLTGTVGQLTYDRQIGVAQEIIGHGLWNPTYWAGKLLVPMILGIVPAVLGAIAVFLLDARLSGGDVDLLLRVLVLIPLAALVGALVGITAAIASFALADPYLISNIANAVLLITAGVVLPLNRYPNWLAAITRLLPFTALVAAVRTTGPVWPLVLRELLVALAWLAVGLLIARRVLALIRSGKRSQEVW